MIALHNSPITAHGNLKSSKCLIDSRWVCKVCDFGLTSVKASQTVEDLGEYAKYRGNSHVEDHSFPYTTLKLLSLLLKLK